MADHSLRTLLARWAAPVLLVVVAVLQIVRTETVDQSPWSGAGFGMFAVVDGEDSRWIVALFDPDDGPTRPVSLPQDLRREAFETRVVPTEERVHNLARDLAARIDEPGSLVVEVWGPDLGHDPLRLEGSLLSRVRVEVTR